MLAAVLGVTMAPVTIRTNPANFVAISAKQFGPLKPSRIPEYTATIAAAHPFTEVIASWSASMTDGTSLSVFVQPEGREGPPYTLGTWSADPNIRTSVNDQKDETARVDTDTLVFAQPQRRITVTVRLQPNAVDAVGQFRALFLHLRRATPPAERPPQKKAWGKTLEPPRRAQNSYPGGNVLCSPTSTSMILAYWAEKLKRPELDADVPEVQAGVFDPAWEGTGNWPFNTAFAASRPGLTAYVTRLRDLRDLEEWLRAGVPVACSVSYALLKGEEKKRANDGHLVVAVGVDSQGDFVFNDPGRAVVRMTYKRADFQRAWAVSGNAVYLVYPTHWAIPAQPGPWANRRFGQ